MRSTSGLGIFETGSFLHRNLAIISAVLVFTFWAMWTFFAVVNQGSWLDETNYFLKSWWYITGQVEPYSARDGTWYLPLYFYNLGLWQLLFGHDMFVVRLNSVALTLLNIFLLMILLRRFGVSALAYAPVLLVFAVNEQSMFYFSSATAYALAVTLQLIALNIAFSPSIGNGPVRDSLAPLAFGLALTMLYFHRINLVPMIAVSICIIWVSAGKARWRYLFTFAALFILVWAILVSVWGKEFAYQSIRLPVLTNYLMEMGLVPDLYPNAFKYSVQMYYEKPVSFFDMLSRISNWADIRDWFFYFHLPAIIAAGFALVSSLVPTIRRRFLIILFLVLFVANSLYSAIGGTLQCSICGQAYMNYTDYLAAIALGLSIQSVAEKLENRHQQIFSIVILFVATVFVFIQFHLLTGRLALPTSQNREVSYTSELLNIENAIAEQLPEIISKSPGVEFGSSTTFGIIGTDLRILYALNRLGYSFPPVTNTLPWDYRKISLEVDITKRQNAREELESLALWTDTTAQNWLSNTYDWILVERKPSRHNFEWLVWKSEGAEVQHALSACFKRADDIHIPNVEPEILATLYYRIKSGNDCNLMD
ncbi:MAG: hypothetical protein ABJL33_15235 [Hyphomicrobiales bacterium]|uniref:hypothetical protein n=1 Tax=Roseibium polysiphoniae TaxID=2571221 RepID=UPI003296A7E2